MGAAELEGDVLGLLDGVFALRSAKHNIDGTGNFPEGILAHATGGTGRAAQAEAAGLEGAAGFARNRIPVGGDIGTIEGDLSGFPCEVGVASAEVDEDQVVIGAAAGELVAALKEGLGEGLGIGLNLLLVSLEGRLHGLGEANGLGGDDVHERAALTPGEDRAVEGLFVLLLGKDEAAARTAEGLVRGRGNKVAMRDRVGVEPGGNEPGDVGDVGEDVGVHAAGDLRHPLEINFPRVGRGTDGDHLRLFAFGLLGQAIVIDMAGFGVHPVVDDIIQFPGEIHRGAMREVPAIGEVHGEDLVARCEDGGVDPEVCLAARVWLNVGVLRPEELLGALDREGFGLVDKFATSIVTLPGISFGIFIGEDGSGGFDHCREGEVLRGNEFDVRFLALALAFDRGIELRIQFSEGRCVEEGFSRRVCGHDRPLNVGRVPRGVNAGFTGIGADPFSGGGRRIGLKPRDPLFDRVSGLTLHRRTFWVPFLPLMPMPKRSRLRFPCFLLALLACAAGLGAQELGTPVRFERPPPPPKKNEFGISARYLLAPDVSVSGLGAVGYRDDENIEETNLVTEVERRTRYDDGSLHQDYERRVIIAPDGMGDVPTTDSSTAAFIFKRGDQYESHDGGEVRFHRYASAPADATFAHEAGASSSLGWELRYRRFLDQRGRLAFMVGVGFNGFDTNFNESLPADLKIKEYVHKLAHGSISDPKDDYSGNRVRGESPTLEWTPVDPNPSEEPRPGEATVDADVRFRSTVVSLRMGPTYDLHLFDRFSLNLGAGLSAIAYSSRFAVRETLNMNSNSEKSTDDLVIRNPVREQTITSEQDYMYGGYVDVGASYQLNNRMRVFSSVQYQGATGNYSHENQDRTIEVDFDTQIYVNAGLGIRF